MKGWIVQRYEYVPGWANVCLYVSPFCRGWDTVAPLIATVCASSSWLVHVTVAPALTVIAAGLNAKLAMLTVVVATGFDESTGEGAAADGVAVADGALAGAAAAGAGPPPHAESISAAPTAAAASSERLVDTDTYFTTAPRYRDAAGLRL